MATSLSYKPPCLNGTRKTPTSSHLVGVLLTLASHSFHLPIGIIAYALWHFKYSHFKIRIPKAYKNISLYKFHNIFSDKSNFVVTIIH